MRDNCTTMLVGKDASLDGSTIIARDEDYDQAYNEKRFVYYPAKKYDELFVSKGTGVEIPLKGEGAGFTAVRDAVEDYGRFDEQGINSYNVAMSATESEASNQRVLGHDPFVPNGIGEDAMLYLVLPFVKSAKEGVLRLGQLVEKYGSSESNGIAFADEDEIWYMETGAGHQWVARRVPDDCYVVAPNMMIIEEIDFADPDNYLFASGIRDFVEKYHLNPNPNGVFNFRDIFAPKDEADQRYNTPRMWYGQKLFNPEIEQEITSFDMPFCRVPVKKIAIEDVQFYLSSHYNGTEYDYLSLKDTSEAKKTAYRPIAVTTAQECSILQLRPGKNGYQAIQWLNFGLYSAAPWVPFYTNILDTPEGYQIKTGQVDPTNSAYWLYKTIQALLEGKQKDWQPKLRKFQYECQSMAVHHVDVTDDQAQEVDSSDLPEFLTAANSEIAEAITKKGKELFDQLVKETLNTSMYSYRP